jgi:hypothetical protein
VIFISRAIDFREKGGIRRDMGVVSSTYTVYCTYLKIELKYFTTLQQFVKIYIVRVLYLRL